MQGVLRPVTALLLATAIAMAGHGILVMLLPLKASAAGFSSFEIGMMGSAYFAGLVGGCLIVPSIISRVGHIRAFSAFTASVTAVPLIHAVAIDPIAWVALRMVQGLCCAGLWLVIESWLNASADTTTRGRVLGAYTLIQLTLQTVGMQMAGSIQLDGLQLFSVAAILFSLSTLPIALTGAIAPMPPKRNKLRLGWLFGISPAATLAAVLVGFATGSFWILAPLYAQNAGLSSGAGATFVSVALLAGAVAQWPLGSLSDKLGRRPIITGSAVVAMASSLGLGLFGSAGLVPIFACSILFGAASFPIYTIALAHANDLVPTKRAIAVSSGMLFVFSFGAAVGPFVASVIVEWAGYNALFMTIAMACGLIVVVTMVRIQIRPRIPTRHREDFVIVPRTTPAVFNLDPRTDDPVATAIAPESFVEAYQAAVPDVIAPDGELPSLGITEDEPSAAETKVRELAPSHGS
ncbi:MAG: MFS transporter [Hyphomicrobiaceae bacterium]